MNSWSRGQGVTERCMGKLREERETDRQTDRQTETETEGERESERQRDGEKVVE